MKTCSYCGRENEDTAARCRECGTELLEPARQPGAAEAPLQRMGVLDNETQAALLGSILNDRKIPHILQSYHDSAFDGLFQAQKGWGIVLAPADYSEEVQAALEGIRRPPQV